MIYLRKITNTDTVRQIETTSEAYEVFFGGDSENKEGIIVKLEAGKFSLTTRISKAAGEANSYRFASVENGPTLSNFLVNINGKMYEAGDIIKIDKTNSKYEISLITKSDERYIFFDSLILPKKNPVIITDFTNSNDYISHTPRQTIYYGVPGSGKSHKIDELTKNLPEEQVLRVVFHPEYTNADFVGQILPTLNQVTNQFEYKFSAGPFAQILRRSYLNPSKEYYLIIEEINRGNAAAIFGDLFQLLDRIEKNKYDQIGGNTYTEGWSSYSINNDYLNWYIRENADSSQYQDVENCVTIPEENKYKDKNYEKYATINIGNFSFISNTGIRLPPNLSILATMNTSDQNVFTLDNAFQRRWDMELVENVYIHEDSSPEDKQNAETQKKSTITVKTKDETKIITWENFQTKINEVIAEKGNESGFSSMEDKRLGCWFIKNQDGVIRTDKFANKVLKYLWDDAFKFNRNDIFIDEIKNFEELKKSFIDEKGFGIFKDMNFSFETEQKNEKQSDSTEQIEETQESQNE